MDTHHSIGNSHVLFMICGSSQVSFPVMLYPFSIMCQQYNQGPVPRQMSWSFASLMAHTPQWRSILLLKLLAHLCSLGLDRQASHASTSRPPQQSHCLLDWIHLCFRNCFFLFYYLRIGSLETIRFWKIAIFTPFDGLSCFPWNEIAVQNKVENKLLGCT